MFGHCMRRVPAIMVLVLLGTAPQEIRSTKTQRGQPFLKQDSIVGIHRGGGFLWPEETQLAYTEAAQRFPGALLEGDIRLTADGHVVMLHDRTVERTTDGAGPVDGMALAQVQQLDAAYHFTPDGGKTYPYRGQGVRIPLFKDVLEACPDSVFLIDLKAGEALPAAAIAVIREVDAADRVILASFLPGLVDKARAIAPGIATAFCYPDGRKLFDALMQGQWEGYRPAAHMLALPSELAAHFDVGAQEVAALKAKGIYTQIHTINDPGAMRKHLTEGFDNILTDRPDLLAEVLASE